MELILVHLSAFLLGFKQLSKDQETFAVQRFQNNLGSAV